MAQFDVYRNPNAATRYAVPFLLDVQSDLLEIITTRVVVPLAREDEIGLPATGLNPSFTIESIPTVMLTEQLAGVSRRALGEQVARMDGDRGAILSALDLLITGI